VFVQVEADAVLLCARGGRRRDTLQATNQRHCRKPLVVMEVDGNHDSMMRHPHVHQTAQAVRAAVAVQEDVDGE
jgi:thioesterase domain-containing protein